VSIKAAGCAVAICLASSAAWAQPAPMAGPMAGLGPILPAQEIGRILRAHGLVPQATPVRNGEAYQVRAVDRLGRQVRVAVDARYGDILFSRPIAMGPPGGYGPYGPPPGAMPPHYGGPPPSTLGAYPPAPGVRPTPPLPERAAALTPVHPPIPRPKPAAKPAAVTPAPATPPEAPATASAPAAAPTPPTAEASAAAPPPPATSPAIPPVTPLD
jgi:hypothetical protein